MLRFHNGPFPGEKLGRLELHTSGDDWTYGAGDVLIRRPGCYVLVIRGERFVEVIAFRARP
jgi:hypothetical protein